METATASQPTKLQGDIGLTADELTTLRRLAAKQEKFDAARRQEPKFTTPEQLHRIESLMDEHKVYVRTNSKDKTKHRVAHVFPAFASVTGEDEVNRGTAEKPDPQIAASYVCVVERFEEEKEKGPDKRPIRKPLGSFNMDALKFLEDFELA